MLNVIQCFRAHIDVRSASLFQVSSSERKTKVDATHHMFVLLSQPHRPTPENVSVYEPSLCRHPLSLRRTPVSLSNGTHTHI